MKPKESTEEKGAGRRWYKPEKPPQSTGDLLYLVSSNREVVKV